MRFIIKTEEFLKGLNIASRAIGSKTGALPILNNLKLDLDETGLYITGTNFDLTIKTYIPYKKDDVEVIRNYKEGSVLLNAKMVTELIRRVNAEEISLETVDTTIALINENANEHTFQCVRVEDFPDLDLDPSGVALKLAKKEFSDLVSQTAFAASVKEQRPILTALNLEASEGVLVATATDSARMARKQIKIPADVEFIANVPAKMMVEIDRLTDGVEEIDIAFSDKKAIFKFADTIVATRLIAGDYPNTKSILPRITNYSLEINSNDLIAAIEKAKIFSTNSDRENVVDLVMSENGVAVTAKSSQSGHAVETISVFKYEGSNLQVSFNSEFVLAAVRALASEDVTFLFVGEMKPFVVKNSLDDSIVQIVTPMRTH